MILQQDKDRQEIVRKVNELLKTRVSKDQYELVEKFAYRYYASSALGDLVERSIEDLAGALLSHWNFVYQRKPGESKVRVFNPTLENDNWQSTHTIIEVSHDDIPFLVDSIRMEVARNNFQIHFIIHFGGLRVLRNSNNCITEILPMGAANHAATSEAPIYVEIDRQVDTEIMKNLQNGRFIGCCGRLAANGR